MTAIWITLGIASVLAGLLVWDFLVPEDDCGPDFEGEKERENDAR